MTIGRYNIAKMVKLAHDKADGTYKMRGWDNVFYIVRDRNLWCYTEVGSYQKLEILVNFGHYVTSGGHIVGGNKMQAARIKKELNKKLKIYLETFM